MGMKAVTLLLSITILLCINTLATSEDAGECTAGGDCSAKPKPQASGCAKRPTVAEIMKDGPLTVTFPWMKKKTAPRYTMPTRGGKGKGKGQRARGWQEITDDYKEEWARHGVKEVFNLNATFIVTKSAWGAAMTDNYFMDEFGLCQEWPRHQVFNHLPQIGRVSLKSNLPATFKQLAQSVPDTAEDVAKLIPATYRLDFAEDCRAWQQKVVDGLIWIHKKDGFHNAKGLQVLDYESAKKMASNCLAIHSGKKNAGKRKLGVVQHYIKKPFLVRGRKCDFRVYFYIANTEPFVTFYSPQFYLKCGHAPYDENSLDFFNVFTNTKVAGVSREEFGIEDWSDVVISPEKFQDYLTEKGLAADWLETEFPKQMKTKLSLVSQVLDPTQDPSRQGSGYEILGLDLMLDEDMNFWLIEVNHSPGLDLERGPRAIAVDTILKAAVGIQVDLMKFAATGRPRGSLALSDMPSRGRLRLISDLGA